MKLIDCKPIRAEILEEAKAGVDKIFADYGKRNEGSRVGQARLYIRFG